MKTVKVWHQCSIGTTSMRLLSNWVCFIRIHNAVRTMAKVAPLCALYADPWHSKPWSNVADFLWFKRRIMWTDGLRRAGSIECSSIWCTLAENGAAQLQCEQQLRGPELFVLTDTYLTRFVSLFEKGPDFTFWAFVSMVVSFQQSVVAMVIIGLVLVEGKDKIINFWLRRTFGDRMGTTDCAVLAKWVYTSVLLSTCTWYEAKESE